MTTVAIEDRSLEREYIRDAEGQFADVPGVPNVLDKLKLESRVQLADGERLASSRRIRSGQWDVLAAEIDTSAGREIRLGVIDPSDRRKWSGGPDPKRSARLRQIDEQMSAMVAERGDDATDTEAYERLSEERDDLASDSDEFNRTTLLTSARVGQLRADIEAGIASARSMIARDERPDSGEFASGVVPGGLDGDVDWRLDDAGTGEADDWVLWLAIRPHGEGDDWLPEGDDIASFDPKNAKPLLSALAELADAHSPESLNRYDLGVRSMPLSRALEAYAVMSPSPAVQLMLYARTLEMAAESFMRAGHLIHIERGKHGRFAKKGVADEIGDAVKAVADTVKAAKPEGRRRSGKGAPKPTADRIRDAYSDLRQGDVPWVGLADLRANMGDIDRAEQDRALMEMLRAKEIRLLPEENQKTINAADLAAAIHVGGEDKHLIGFNDVIDGRAPSPSKPKTATQMRRRADKLLSDMPSDQAGRDRVHAEVGGLTLDADRVEADSRKATLDKLRAMRDNPQPGGSERMAAELSKLKHADLDDVEAELGIERTKGTKAQRVEKITQRAVGDKLDRDAIMNVKMYEPPPATKAEADAYFRDRPKPLSTFGQIAASHKAMLDADREKALAKKAAAAEPKPARARRGGDTASALDALRPMVDNPKPGDREKTDAILAKLTSKQLDEVAKHHGFDVSYARNVQEKRDRLRENLVGAKLNSLAIRGGGWEDENAMAAKFEQQQTIGKRLRAQGAVRDSFGNVHSPGSRGPKA